MKPTIEECLKVIEEINKDISQSKELLKHKANLLYILNRMDFWEDFPVLYELIQYEIKLKQEKERCPYDPNKFIECPVWLKSISGCTDCPKYFKNK